MFSDGNEWTAHHHTSNLAANCMSQSVKKIAATTYVKDNGFVHIEQQVLRVLTSRLAYGTRGILGTRYMLVHVNSKFTVISETLKSEDCHTSVIKPWR